MCLVPMKPQSSGLTCCQRGSCLGGPSASGVLFYCRDHRLLLVMGLDEAFRDGGAAEMTSFDSTLKLVRKIFGDDHFQRKRGTSSAKNDD